MYKNKEESKLIDPKCDKCGSDMVKRLLPVQDSPTLDFVNILQCNACRWYFEYTPEIQPSALDIKIPESEEVILKKAYELGIEYEKKYAGCAQTIVAAMFEALGLWSDDIFKAASGLANGLGLTGNGTCAALLGASMVISYIFGREHNDFKEKFESMKSYALIKRLHNVFIRKYGACQCSDVQRNQLEVTWVYDERNEMKGHLRTHMIDCCSEIIGNIARSATKIILKNGYTPGST